MGKKTTGAGGGAATTSATGSKAAKPTAALTARRTEAAAAAPPDKPERKTLTADEKRLLDECIEQCRLTEDTVSDALTTLGRFLLLHLFGGRGKSYLEGEKVPGLRVWRQLLSHAGGPKVRLNDRILSEALRIAAWDDALHDDHWRSLDAGRKALLLPLEEQPLLVEGARHVMAMGLTQDATRAYVAQVLRSAHGKEPDVRLTPARFRARFQNLRASLGTAASRRRLRALAESLDAKERQELVRELDETARFLRDIRHDIRLRKR